MSKCIIEIFEGLHRIHIIKTCVGVFKTIQKRQHKVSILMPVSLISPPLSPSQRHWSLESLFLHLSECVCACVQNFTRIDLIRPTVFFNRSPKSQHMPLEHLFTILKSTCINTHVQSSLSYELHKRPLQCQIAHQITRTSCVFCKPPCLGTV